MWLPDTPQDHDDRMIEVGRSEAKDRIAELEAALSGIVRHWREFGEMMVARQEDYGLDERIEAAAKLIPDCVLQIR